MEMDPTQHAFPLNCVWAAVTLDCHFPMILLQNYSAVVITVDSNTLFFTIPEFSRSSQYSMSILM